MTFRLIRIDPAWRAAWGWLAMLGTFYLARWIWRIFVPYSPSFWTADETQLWAIMRAWNTSMEATGTATLHGPDLRVIFHALTTPVAWIVLYGVLLVCVTGTAWHRSNQFLASLPIFRREILMARVVSLTALVWISAITGYLVFDVFSAPPSIPAWRLLGFPAAATLAVIVLQSVRLQEKSCPFWAVAPCWAAALFSVWTLLPPPLFTPVPLFVAVAYPAALLACAMAIFLLAWKTVPPSFDVISGTTFLVEYSWGGSWGFNGPPAFAAPPRDWPEPLPAIRSGPEAESKRPAWRVVAGAGLRSYWHMLVGLGVACFTAYFYPVMPFFWAISLNPAGSWLNWQSTVLWESFQLSRWLSGLPIQPRNPLRVMMALLFIASLAGYFVGIYGPFNLSPDLRLTASQNWTDWQKGDRATPECPILNVMPSLEFWKPVEGAPPDIRAPWGEVFQPPSSHVLGVDVYNPFAVGCRSSVRFFNWQWERATARLYGRPMAFRTDGGWMPQAIPQFRRQIVTTAAFAVAILLLGISRVIVNWWRLQRIPQGLVRFLGLAIALPISLAGYLFVLYTDGFRALNEDALLRVVWALPENPLFALAILGITVVILYWIFDRLSREMEFVGGASSAGSDV